MKLTYRDGRDVQAGPVDITQAVYAGTPMVELRDALLDAVTPRDDADPVYLGYDPSVDRFIVGFDAIRHLHEAIDTIGRCIVSDSACYGLIMTCHVLDDGSIVPEDAVRDWGTMFHHTHGSYSKIASRPGIVELKEFKAFGAGQI